MSFIHLRVHSEYSLNDSVISISDLVDKAHSLNMKAIALTDHNNVFAAIKFYETARAKGIKPILGADILIECEAGIFPMTLLCQNNEGYGNLLQLLSRLYLERPKTHAIDITWLNTHNVGLLALSNAQTGWLGHTLLNEPAKQESVWNYLNQLFENRFYIELQRLHLPDELTYLELALDFAERHQVPVIATQNVRFLNAEDFEAHEARICIQTSDTLNNPKRPRLYSEDQYLCSTQEMEMRFSAIPSAITNTWEIAKRCNVTIELGVNHLPIFPLKPNELIEIVLREQTQLGLSQKLKISPSEWGEHYHNRLNLELDVINKMGFAGYFLIVADFTRWARDNRIPVGPGRGSGPGSLVAYGLGITDLDPLQHDLLFERFLNPERVSMPDFDIDFCIHGRDRVIDYVMEKYGRERVAQIMTYGTMAAKAVVRDAGRVLGFPYGFVDKIAKLIPFDLGITLDKALEQEPLLAQRYDKEDDVKTLMDLARKLEGLVRNVGKHAGGIVIAKGLLTDYTALYAEPDALDYPVTQFDKDDLEKVGLVKFDFLGLKTLTIISHAVDQINENRKQNQETLIDILQIPLDDALTFELLKKCQSTAIFQLESHGMRDLIRRMQPDCFEDLVALVALFRPGPLQSGMVEDFIQRKQGKAIVNYLHPKIEPVLKNTYGVIVYQEQVMQIAQILAGFTLGAADILRRAMGKKKPEEMAKQREIFCKGAIANQVNQSMAEQIFDLMEKFAGYGFNKSHSASYALIAYQTAWLKAHYPANFMASVLTADMGNTDKIMILLSECKALGLEVLPPSIFESEFEFKVVGAKQLRYGLGAVKGLGEGAIEQILLVRKQKSFQSLFDFCARCDLKKVNKRSLEALIKSGAMDNFKIDRGVLFFNLEFACQYAEQQLQNQLHKQKDLFSSTEETQIPEYKSAPLWSLEETLQHEKSALGFYLSGSPLQAYSQDLANCISCSLLDLKTTTQTQVNIAGIITQSRTRITKRGDAMGIITLSDGSEEIEIVFFREVFQAHRHLLIEDQCVLIQAERSLDLQTQQIRIIAKHCETLENIRKIRARSIEIELNTFDEIDSEQLQLLLSPYLGGNCQIQFYIHEQGQRVYLNLGNAWRVFPENVLIQKLNKQFPQATIQVLY